MQQAGTESWRFAESVPTFAHVALFVRDALRLETGSQAVPPRPVRDVPDLSQRLDPAIRRQAGAEWAGWWEAVIRLEAGVEGAGHGPGPALARARRQDLAFDPPEWDSLADRTGLRRAVVAAYEEGRSLIRCVNHWSCAGFLSCCSDTKQSGGPRRPWLPRQRYVRARSTQAPR